MKISASVVKGLKNSLAVFGFTSSALLIILALIILQNEIDTFSLIVAIFVLFLPSLAVVFLSMKLFRGAQLSKDWHLFTPKQISLSDVQREEQILEQIRVAALQAGIKKQKEYAKQQTLDANLDALEVTSGLSREELEAIAKSVRQSNER